MSDGDAFSESSRIAAARTFLFVPGNRPERFEKAQASGADFVIIDLEDSVADNSKELAIAACEAWLREHRRAIVRVNGKDSPIFARELALIEQPGVAGVMVPKAAADDVMARIATVRPAIPLIESAKAVIELVSIAQVPGVIRLALGAIDLALDVGFDDRPGVLDAVRTTMSCVSRAYGLAAPVDGVTTNVDNEGVLQADVRLAAAFGFRGKLCIHPRQVARADAAFTPDAETIAAARRLTEADLASGSVAIDGQMVDRPVLERARRLIAEIDDRQSAFDVRNS